MSLAASLWSSSVFWRGSTAVVSTLALALLVAALIAREPPDFSATPIVTVVRDGEQHPVWTIRLARAAHQIAVDSVRPAAPPAGKVYQLWLLTPASTVPHPLGLLPQSGRKRVAVTPENARLLALEGELEVTLEPMGGSAGPVPSGPTVFRGSLEGSG
jgi:anti-sigma-K factor RskA